MHAPPPSRIGTAILALLLGSSMCARADDSPKPPTIYDAKANAPQSIADATAKADRHGKRVLLMFGANWCPWCHKLHDLFTGNDEIKRILRDEYELVLVDVDQDRNAKVLEKYGNPRKHGLPALVVLDDKGRHVHTQDTGSLEEGDHHDPAKVRVFLKKYQASRRNAGQVLADGLATTKKAKKKAFLNFTAPWCPWCHRLDAYLNDPAVAEVFGKAFVPILIDVERMTGGDVLVERYRSTDEGIPYFAILDSSGNKLADSHGEKGNVGFPVEPQEIAHFMKVIRTQATGLDEADFKFLEKRIRAAAPKEPNH